MSVDSFFFNMSEDISSCKCTRRQINYQILRNNYSKIGLNTTASKFYPLTNLLGLNMLNLNFVPLKKLAKIQFLEYGKT